MTDLQRSVSTAFRAQPPNLRLAPLMDMGFAVNCPLAQRSRLISGSCPSARAFAVRRNISGKFAPYDISPSAFTHGRLLVPRGSRRFVTPTGHSQIFQLSGLPRRAREKIFGNCPISERSGSRERTPMPCRRHPLFLCPEPEPDRRPQGHHPAPYRNRLGKLRAD